MPASTGMGSRQLAGVSATMSEELKQPSSGPKHGAGGSARSPALCTSCATNWKLPQASSTSSRLAYSAYAPTSAPPKMSTAFVSCALHSGLPHK